MKKLLLLLVFSNAFHICAQKNMEGMVQAERAFSHHSARHGTKSAFLQFLDSSGIIFLNTIPINGIEIWQSMEAPRRRLSWQPIVAGMPASNDFGYRTGPWILKEKDAVVATGLYTNVLHLNKKGKWKFLVDQGNVKVPALENVQLRTISPGKNRYENDLSMFQAEAGFIKACLVNKDNAYKKYISGQAIINCDGRLPAASTENQQSAIALPGSNPFFILTGYGVAASGDLGYVYGKVEINGRQDTYMKIRAGNPEVGRSLLKWGTPENGLAWPALPSPFIPLPLPPLKPIDT
jgi:hypothetical protein